MKTYKIIEIAKRYAVHEQTVYGWIKSGKLLHETEKHGLREWKIITDAHLAEFEARFGIKPVN